MRVYGLRIPIVLVFFLLTITGAIGARQVLFESRVRLPLEEALATIDGVEDVTVLGGSGPTGGGLAEVRVRIAADADLELTYDRIVSTVEELYPEGGYRLHLEDGRDEHLRQAFREARLAIEEGIATGAFRDMAGAVEALQRKYGLQAAHVSVDADFVYLTLRSDDAYLHHVAARPSPDARGRRASP